MHHAPAHMSVTVTSFSAVPRSHEWHLYRCDTMLCNRAAFSIWMPDWQTQWYQQGLAIAGGIVGGGFAALGSLTLTELFKGRYTFKAPRKYGGYFRKDSDHRDFVSIGTAAGAAASWLQSPLGCPDSLVHVFPT